MKPGLHVRLEAGLLGEGRRQSIEGRGETEVVERLGTQLNRKAPDVLERDRDELAKLCERGVEAVGPLRLLDRLEPEQDRGQRLPCFVVELT